VPSALRATAPVSFGVRPKDETTMPSKAPRSLTSIALAYGVLAPFFAGLFLWVWHHWRTNLAGADDPYWFYCLNMFAYGTIAALLACIPSFLAGLLWAKAIPHAPDNAVRAGTQIILVASGLGFVVAAPYFYWLPFYGAALLVVGAIGGACAAAPLVSAMLRSARQTQRIVQ